MPTFATMQNVYIEEKQLAMHCKYEATASLAYLTDWEAPLELTS